MKTRLTYMAAALVIAGALAPTTRAAEGEAPAGPNTGAISFTAGFDVTSQYWFRGLAQENQGGIIQPWLDMSITLIDNDDFSFATYIGTWNSVHSGNPTDGWYEADFYIGGAFEIKSLGVGVDISYINLYNPDGGGIFTEEIDLGFSYDDSALWGDSGFALNPYATFAFEINGGSDNGTSEGVYLELGIEPSFTIIESETQPVDLAIPVALGLSLDDYYEDGQAANDDDLFGFLDIGAVLSTPLPVPAEYGSWSLSFGVHVIFLGDTAETIAGPTGFGVTGGDSTEFYAHFGISIEY